MTNQYDIDNMEILNAESGSRPNYNERRTMQNNNDTDSTSQTRKGDYILGETIGQGAFAKVKIATHIHTNEKVAIKILDKSFFVDNEKDVCRIQKEITILKRLRHKNIIQLYEIIESASNLYIIMDYCEGKELFDYIIRKNKLSEKRACKFFQQIINGVEYLHLQNITHRDLKPENLLLDKKENIVISDFGLSFASSKPDCLLQTPCGTPSYAPPEMLRGDHYVGAKSDIWSCGIILYTMLCGNLPCAESKEELIYQCFYNKTYDYPSHLSTSVVDLIKRLLKFNPEERIGFDQIKKHPWFNLVRPQMKPGIIVNVQKIPVDEDILNKVQEFGYKPEDCKNSVLNNKYDHLSAIYYLIQKQLIREGKKAISDMNSELYDNYIKNIINWEQPEEYKDKKYKDYWPEQGLNRVAIQRINSLVSPKDKISQQDTEAEAEKEERCINSTLFSLEKSSSQGEPLKNHIINLHFEPITESNTSVNSLNHFPINVTLHSEVNKTKNNCNSSINININTKQTTFTSSSKKQHNTKLFYPQLTQKQQPIIKLNKTKRPDINETNSNHHMEYINDTHKQSLLLKIGHKISSFNKDIKAIDLLNWNNISNSLQLIGKKLIKSTIFGRFLLNKKPNAIYREELEEKFYRLQKYKELVENIKATKRNIFPKRILDWNYYTFEVFLNNKEDYIFSDAYIKSNINASFVEKMTKSIQNEKRAIAYKRNLSKNLFTQSADEPRLKNILSIDKDQFFSSERKPNQNRHYPRLNRLIVSPSHLCRQGNTTITRSRSIRQESRDNSSIRFPTCVSIYSSSSMNNISEDEELIKGNEAAIKMKLKKMTISTPKEPFNFLNSKFDIKPRSICSNKQRKQFAYLNSPTTQIKYPQMASFYSSKKHNQSFKAITSPKSPDRNNSNSYTNFVLYNSPSTQMNQHNDSLNMRQITVTSKQKQKHNMANDINDNSHAKEEEYYTSQIVDCGCVFQPSRNIMLQLLKQFFKQNNYFFNCISEYKIKCSKANTQFEFELMKIKFKETLMTYLKISKSKGSNSEYVKVMKEMFLSFPI